LSKICLISDLHFGVRKNNEVFIDSQLRFINEQFIPYLNENGIKKICILGDLFDNRQSTNTKVMNAVHSVFDKLRNFEIYVLVGNHDTYFTSSIEVNSLKFLNEFHNVTLIEKITSVEFNNRKFVMAPWITNIPEFISQFNGTKCDVCLGHFNIFGFQYNKQKRSEDGIESNIFSGCNKVFTGHFHIRNVQNLYGSEIIYIGSPFQLTRNDIDEERGFVVLNTEDLSYEFISNTVSLKYISLKFPEKFSYNRVHNNIVDVHIDYNDRYDESKIDRYVKRIEEYEPAVPPNILVDNNTDFGSGMDLNCCNIGSIMDLIREYIDMIEVENKEDIYSNLADLYNEAKSE
jgi:DNA repair exonuclease SbcCD nuclease subunit